MAASLLVSTALAANPAGWSAAATPEPSQVSFGQGAGFIVHFQNDGPSNISQLYLVAATPAGATFVSASIFARYGTYATGSCPSGQTYLCALGPVNDGEGLDVLVIYTAPSSGTSMTVNFEFNTSGVVVGGRNKSHGDALPAPATVDLSSSTRDFFGRFAYDETQLTVFDDEALSNKNKQSTKAFGPETNIPITVGEVPLSTFTCPTDPARTRACFSQWSTLNVNGGVPYPNGFMVQIGFSQFELPNGIDASNIKFIHVKDGGGVEVIKNQCSDDTPAASELPCYLASDSGHDVIATLFLTENGRINGW